MPKYKVTLEGENFPMVFDGSEMQLFGFITTRRVRANSVKDAKKLALDIVNNDEALFKSIDKSVDAKPSVYVSNVDELKWWNRLGGGGYSFFPMDEEQMVAD